MTDTTRFVGIDISKSSFDVCVLPDGRSASFANSAEGIADFLVFIEPFCGIERVVLEPTGGYERHVFAALQAGSFCAGEVMAMRTTSDFVKPTGVSVESCTKLSGYSAKQGLAPYLPNAAPALEGGSGLYFILAGYCALRSALSNQLAQNNTSACAANHNQY